MDLVIVILGIIFLATGKCGTALAICAIVEGVLVCINAIVRRVSE